MCVRTMACSSEEMCSMLFIAKSKGRDMSTSMGESGGGVVICVVGLVLLLSSLA